MWLGGVVARVLDSWSGGRGIVGQWPWASCSHQCACLSSSISWYLARAFMSTCHMWQPWHESNEQGE